jgi:hypothetical protein
VFDANRVGETVAIDMVEVGCLEGFDLGDGGTEFSWIVLGKREGDDVAVKAKDIDRRWFGKRWVE